MRVLLLPVALLLVACGGGPTPTADSAAPRVVVEVVRKTVAAGEDVEAVVRFENLGPEGSLTVAFGDGTYGPGVAQTDSACGPVPGETSERPVRHAYREAGTWTITATLATACGGGARVTYTGTATVVVTAKSG